MSTTHPGTIPPRVIKVIMAEAIAKSVPWLEFQELSSSSKKFLVIRPRQKVAAKKNGEAEAFPQETTACTRLEGP